MAQLKWFFNSRSKRQALPTEKTAQRKSKSQNSPEEDLPSLLGRGCPGSEQKSLTTPFQHRKKGKAYRFNRHTHIFPLYKCRSLYLYIRMKGLGKLYQCNPKNASGPYEGTNSMDVTILPRKPVMPRDLFGQDPYFPLERRTRLLWRARKPHGNLSRSAGTKGSREQLSIRYL